MAEGGGEGEDKTEEATARKLEQAREKGDVAKSTDLAQALSFIGACAVIIFYGDQIVLYLTETLSVFLAIPHQLLGTLETGGLDIVNALGIKILPVLAFVMLAGALLGVAGHVLQTGLMFSPEKIKPTWAKINPIEGFKRLFGVDAMIQFGKTLLKLLVVGWIVWFILKARAVDVAGLSGGSVLMILPYAKEVFIALAVAVCIFLLIEGGLDYFLQKYRFAQRMKMSITEVKDEYKQTEGDPLVKAQLRQIRMEKSRQRMMTNVPTATVIITNPTHYAIALRYDETTAAPTCVAKGVDTLALKIREVAADNNVPIVEDPPLARALYAAIEVDDIIPEAQFQAVAKIISFVMVRKKRGF
jgi:flagellar biosynthesis protein FlhB